MKRMSSLLISSMPFSKEFFSLTATRDFAMFPKYVSSPVLRTRAIADPDTMLVPRNPMLGSSVMGSMPLAVVNFSTGLDSPVREAWSTNVSFVSKNLTSAGTMSPDDSLRRSPGTSSSTSTVCWTPSLMTSILLVIRFLSFFAAESERADCTKDMIAEMITVLMISMNVA